MEPRWLNHVHPQHRMLLTNFIDQVVRFGADANVVLNSPIPDAQDPTTNSTYKQELQEMAGAINSTGRLIDKDTGQPIGYKIVQVSINMEGKFKFAPDGMKLDTIYCAQLPQDTTGISFATDSGSGMLLAAIMDQAGDPWTAPADKQATGMGAVSPSLPGKKGQSYNMLLIQGQETFPAHGSMSTPGATSAAKSGTPTASTKVIK